MTDRRRSDDYKQVSGYVPIELARQFKSICAHEGISQSDALEEIIREWIAKKTYPLNSQPVTPKTVAELVQANMMKLRHCGVKNLRALARGEVLPTVGDFAIITSALAISEEEKKIIWQETFKPSLYRDYGSIQENECQCP
jgi:hypothetical protein